MTFTSSTRRTSSIGASTRGANTATAASLIQTSMRPKRATASSARACTCCSSVTSVGRAAARAPSARHSAASSSSASARLLASTRLAPSFANRSAVALPIPLDAPVMTTTC